MPGTPATGSTEIAIVDSKIVADLCAGLFRIDATPTTYIGSGADTVLGANVQILNPYGVEVKPYGDDYEIAPDLSGGMNGVITYNIPTQANNYQYGTYTVNLKMFDSAGGSWVVTKTVKICAPDKNNKTRKYGSLSAQMKVDCVAGKLYVIVDGVPTYNGHIMESQVLEAELEYPTGSELDPIDVTTGNFSVTLFEGVYKLEGEICATYNYGDNVFVKVKYKIKKEHHARCIIDRCCLLAALSELQGRTATDCSDAEKERTASTILEAINLDRLIQLAADCGEDPSDYVVQLEKLLGCSCTCNCAEGTPIIGTTPSNDIVIDGCNIETSVDGLTTTYTINNYEYVVEINDNGGALVASTATLDGCTKTQLITFDISVVYSQIKTLANQNNTEADFWASVVNKSLRDVDPNCLNLTEEQWQALTLPAKFAAIITKMCACCGTCDSTITGESLTQSGADAVLTWQGSAYSYDVYLDGLLVATILTSAWPSDVYSHTFAGAADNEEHTWLIVSRCDTGAIGETATGQFQFLGCPEVASTLMNDELITDGVVTGACPFDLTSLVSLSNPDTVEWHTANNTLAATLVSNPASVGGGTYYAFNRDGDNCYSLGTRITVNCSAEESCTAPQNLEVVQFGVNNFFIKFQSAAYPPPSNSYTVKRRLASDPDVGGSYTTIGTPTWNASLNRWVITDNTAVDNTLYVYKAISNCGSTEPSIDYTYVNAICPTMILYPTDSTVAYSFTPPGGTATAIKVRIYDSSGTVTIHTDTYTTPFSTPTEGLFEYLDPSTTYKVQIIISFGTEEAVECAMQTVTTDPAP